MAPRQRAKAAWTSAAISAKKGRLTLQAAQGWEERDGRTDAAHRTISFAKRVVEIQVPPAGGRRRLAILAEESRFSGMPPRQNRRPRMRAAHGLPPYPRHAASTSRRS